jgi:hypothetical protein
MPEWLPTDPRQREIHRLLLLVGGEPAAFFLDAARLMDGDFRLFSHNTLLISLDAKWSARP